MLIFSLITITASWNIISISALIFFNTCFSSYLPVSMSRRHVHNRAGVFHTLYIVQRDTIICPYFVKFSTLYQFPLSHIWGSFILIPPPLFSQPILFRRLRLPCLSQVNSRLFPPPHPNPCPMIPLLRLVYFQKWSRCNILRVHIHPLMDLGFHRLKPRLRSRRLRWGVLPLYVQPPLWKRPSQSTT